VSTYFIAAKKQPIVYDQFTAELEFFCAFSLAIFLTEGGCTLHVIWVVLRIF